MLDVDLKYPDELHEWQYDYALVPKKLEICQNISSNYCSIIVNDYGIKIGDVNKLFPNLGNKSKSLYKSSVLFIIRNEIWKVWMKF